MVSKEASLKRVFQPWQRHRSKSMSPPSSRDAVQNPHPPTSYHSVHSSFENKKATRSLRDTGVRWAPPRGGQKSELVAQGPPGSLLCGSLTVSKGSQRGQGSACAFLPSAGRGALGFVLWCPALTRGLRKCPCPVTVGCSELDAQPFSFLCLSPPPPATPGRPWPPQSGLGLCSK